MPLEEEQLNQLIDQPSETLSIELKDWIDPDSCSGIEKIVKACLAMRNNDGGYLLLGFNNSDGSPNPNDAPDDVSNIFHIDKIQGYITRFSSEPFEVFIYFPRIHEKNYVVIEIPTGVKTPVATKSGLTNSGKDYIKADKIFVRTLNANNTPSTAEAKWKDWPSVMEKCFENREADVGRFIRRHLSNASLDELKNAFSSIFTEDAHGDVSRNDVLSDFLDASFERYVTIVREREIEMPSHGSMEVGIIIDGDINEYFANWEFLNLISATNPGLTGWPVWGDSRSFKNESHRPFVFDGVWEAFVAVFGPGVLEHLDYWRVSPEGRFYLYRALQDDTGATDRAPEPGTVLDFGLAILRAAECMIVAIAFAKAMGAQEDAKLKMVYRWKGLRGRTLSSWTNSERLLPYERSAYQDELVSTIDVPVDTAPGAIADYVHSVISRLFHIFEGSEVSGQVTEDLTRRLLERRL